jgi:hypothetical protein
MPFDPGLLRRLRLKRGTARPPTAPPARHDLCPQRARRREQNRECTRAFRSHRCFCQGLVRSLQCRPGSGDATGRLWGSSPWGRSRRDMGFEPDVVTGRPTTHRNAPRARIDRCRWSPPEREGRYAPAKRTRAKLRRVTPGLPAAKTGCIPGTLEAVYAEIGLPEPRAATAGEKRAAANNLRTPRRAPSNKPAREHTYRSDTYKEPLTHS